MQVSYNGFSPTHTDLKKKFITYNSKNPAVWQLFKKYTLMAIKSGRKTYSAKAIFERIRWFHEIEGRDSLGFKLSNNHTAYYSRLFMERYPQYRGFFKLKAVRGDDG